MIFVDTNVFMYAVGRPHALQATAQRFFVEANRSGAPLCTSAEVMQELAHVYLPTGRLQTFDATLELMASAAVEVWPLEEADVALARQTPRAVSQPASPGPLPPGQLPAEGCPGDQDLRPGIGGFIKRPVNPIGTWKLD